MKIGDCKIQFSKKETHLNGKIQKICFKNGVFWATAPPGQVYRKNSAFLYIRGNSLSFMDHGDREEGGVSEGEECFHDDELPEMAPAEFIKRYTPAEIKPKDAGLAARNNKNKAPLSYIFDFPEAVTEFCKVCESGAKKYDRNNWKKGFPYTEVIDSLLRHIKDFQNGEGFYEETLPSGEVVTMHHMGNAMWNCAAVLEQDLAGRKDLDDRYVEGNTENDKTKTKTP